MKKCFELPIYALDRETLTSRVRNYINQIKTNTHLAKTSEETKASVIEKMTFPQRIWDYNHIVGYITVGISGRDIVYHVFLPTPQIQRYNWRSGKKKYTYDIEANGAHFRVDSLDYDEIGSKISAFLDDVIEAHVPKKYYVDRECFDRMNAAIDYKRIIEDCSKE